MENKFEFDLKKSINYYQTIKTYSVLPVTFSIYSFGGFLNVP